MNPKVVGSQKEFEWEKGMLAEPWQSFLLVSHLNSSLNSSLLPCWIVFSYPQFPSEYRWPLNLFQVHLLKDRMSDFLGFWFLVFRRGSMLGQQPPSSNEQLVRRRVLIAWSTIRQHTEKAIWKELSTSYDAGNWELRKKPTNIRQNLSQAHWIQELIKFLLLKVGMYLFLIRMLEKNKKLC